MKHTFENYKIAVYEPFADFLLGETEESNFELTLLDVVRFAGHACPSMIGAFLIAQRVVQEFYPDTGICVRGEILVDIPTAVTSGATGPIANVFGYIFGCWSHSGFGGISNQFVRRDLVRFAIPEIPVGTFRFYHTPTGRTIDVSYNPSLAGFEPKLEESFQQQWRKKIFAILQAAEKVVLVENINSAQTMHTYGS